MATPTHNSIGHSTRSIEELVDILRAHGVQRLADIRTIPRSRRVPQFNSDALSATLAAAGIAYVHLPALGGLRKPRPDSTNTAWRNESFRGYADYMATEAFTRGLDALLDLASREPTVMMCAEAVPWRCHRSLVADALLARGVRTLHLMSATKADEHVLTSFGKIVDGRVVYSAADASLDAARSWIEASGRNLVDELHDRRRSERESDAPNREHRHDPEGRIE